MNSASTRDTARAGVVVVAPTTDQPIILQRLAVMAKLPTSRVVLGNETADQCEGWTKDYNNLMRPDAPARALLGAPETGGFRLVVSADVDHGKSWMLPVLTAHAASARDLPVTDKIAQARALIWSTGAVGMALADTLAAARVVDDDYHLKSKVDRSRALFADAAHAGTPVICLLPNATGAAEAATWLAAVLKGQPHHIRIISDLAEMVDVVTRFARRGVLADLDQPSNPPEPAAPAAVAGTQLVPASVASAAGGPSSGRETPGPAPEADLREPPAVSAAPAADTLSTAQADGDRAPLQRPTPPQAHQPPAAPTAGLPVSVAVLLVAGAVMTAGALGYMALVPAPAPRPPAPGPSPNVVSPQPVVAPTASAEGGAPVVRLGLLRASAGRSCQALVLEMQPRFDEVEQMVAAGQGPVEIDRTQVCGLSLSGVAPVSARFQALGREVIVPSLSQGNRIIFNPAGMAGQTLVIELGGAQTGRIDVTLR